MSATVTYGQPANVVARPIIPTPKRKPPQLSTEQRLQIAQKRSANKRAIESDIHEWYEESLALAEDLHRRFPGKGADHYLNLMFSGALKLRNTCEPNSFNAWLHHIAQSNGGANAIALGKENIDQYYALSSEQKEQLVDELVESRLSEHLGLRLDKRGRSQDVFNICKKIEDMLVGLQARVGVEAFFCVVRSNPDFDLKPRWWFTSPELDQYLRGTVRKFAPDRIGILAEAFAISGSDVFATFKNAKEKVAWLKGEIRDLVQDGLVEITGVKDIKMSYVQFTRDIEIPYGITLQGWKTDSRPWCNPSQLSNDIDMLKDLRNALLTGDCAFVRLTPTELSQKKNEYKEQVKAGNVPQRKKRKDAGKKRKKGAAQDSDDDNEQDPSKRARVNGVGMQEAETRALEGSPPSAGTSD